VLGVLHLCVRAGECVRRWAGSRAALCTQGAIDATHAGNDHNTAPTTLVVEVPRVVVTTGCPLAACGCRRHGGSCRDSSSRGVSETRSRGQAARKSHDACAAPLTATANLPCCRTLWSFARTEFCLGCHAALYRGAHGLCCRGVVCGCKNGNKARTHASLAFAAAYPAGKPTNITADWQALSHPLRVLLRVCLSYPLVLRIAAASRAAG